MQEYTIVERYIDGIETIGFIIEDNANNRKTLKISDVIKLALSKRITNAEAVLNEDNNDYELLITDTSKLIDSSTDRNTDKFSLVARIVDESGSLKGYIIKDKNGNKYKVDNRKAWKLAKDNKLDGVKAYIINTRKTIISENTDDPVLKKLRDVKE